MGVQGFSALLRNSKEQANLLSELGGKVCGLDVSVVLHNLYSQQDFAINFHAIPPVDLYIHVEKMFNRIKSTFDSANVTLVMYVDGCSHPGKAREDASRQTMRTES